MDECLHRRRRILKSADAGTAKDPRTMERDQLYAMVTERYALMRRIGSWIWGDDVDAHVPPLCSAPLHSKKAAATEVKAENAASVATPANNAAPTTAAPSASAPASTATPESNPLALVTNAGVAAPDPGAKTAA